MALRKEHLLNCYNQALKSEIKNIWLYIGYMEACLVQFGVIESKNNGVRDYQIKVKRWYGSRDEYRYEIIMRLTAEYLKKEGLLN